MNGQCIIGLFRNFVVAKAAKKEAEIKIVLKTTKNEHQRTANTNVIGKPPLLLECRG
jgi:hypothetical protein